MLLRRSSERRAPLSYQGDGTYSNFPGSRLEHAPSKSDDDGATTLPYSPNFVRAHDGVASRSKRARPPPAAFELSHRPAFPLSNALTTAHTPDMANIKYIRPHGGPAPPPRDSVPKKRQPRTERSVTVESTAPTTSTEPLPRRPCAHVVTLEMADGKPAIFPTLNIDEAFREAPDGKHGIVRFLEERGHAQWDTLDASRLRVDRLYECKRFPDAMFSKERKWYQELKDRMTSPEGKAKLETFYDAFAFKRTFRDLWPSLRQTIIEEIRDEAHGVYKSEYWPVLCLLGLAQSELVDILHENNQVWDSEAEIPQHLLELKRKFPDKPIDPDTPPPSEIMLALLYLKQEHLPASLLGEWQFPLPEFDLPTKTIAEPIEGIRAKEIKKTAPPAAVPARVPHASSIAAPSTPLPAASQVISPKWPTSVAPPTAPARPPRTPSAPLPADIILPTMSSSLGKALNDGLQHELGTGIGVEQKQEDYMPHPKDAQAEQCPKYCEDSGERTKSPPNRSVAGDSAGNAAQSSVKPGDVSHRSTERSPLIKSGPSLAPPPSFLQQNKEHQPRMAKNPVVGHFAAPVVRNPAQYRQRTPTIGRPQTQNKGVNSATEFLQHFRADQKKEQSVGMKNSGSNNNIGPAVTANKTSSPTHQQVQRRTSNPPSMARLLDKHYELIYNSPNSAKPWPPGDNRSSPFPTQRAEKSLTPPERKVETPQANPVPAASADQKSRSDSVTRPSPALSAQWAECDRIKYALEKPEQAQRGVHSPNTQFSPTPPQREATSASPRNANALATSYLQLQQLQAANGISGRAARSFPSAQHYLPQHYAPPMTPPQQILGTYASNAMSPQLMTMLSQRTGSGMAGSILQQYPSQLTGQRSAGSPRPNVYPSFASRAIPRQSQVSPLQSDVKLSHSPPQRAVSSLSGSPPRQFMHGSPVYNDPRLHINHPAWQRTPSVYNRQTPEATAYYSGLHPVYKNLSSSGTQGPYFFRAGEQMTPYLPHQSPDGAYPSISPHSFQGSPPLQHAYPQQRPPQLHPQQQADVSEASLDPRLMAGLHQFGDQAGYMPVGSFGDTAPSNSVLEDMRVNVNSVLEVNSLMRPNERKRTADRMQEGEGGAKRVGKRPRQ